MIIRWREDVKRQVKFKIKGEQDIEDVEDKIKGAYPENPVWFGG